MVRDERKGRTSRRSRSRSEERPRKRKSSREETSPSRDRRERRRPPSGSPESRRKKCKRKEKDRRGSPSFRGSDPPPEREHPRDERHSGPPRDRPNRSRQDGDRRSPRRRPDHKKEVWGKPDEEKDKKKTFVENIAKPDFGLSGKLAEETNTYKGVVIKYSQPPEARIPKRRWRLYPFKGDEVLPTLYIHRQSAYLIGRERKIADFPVDHPSISKQHAVLQYRAVPYTKPDGTKGNRIRPYIIDLNSANGTYVNNQRIEPQKYVELLERDVIKFAYSSREYVLLHEQSQDDADDDDNDNPPEDTKPILE